MTELDLLTAGELADCYRSGRLSPVEVTRAVLDTIAELDPVVHAFVLVDADGALAAARGSERRWRAGRPLGPFDGVPASIKDLLLTAGWPTLRGSRLLDAAGPWSEDAPAVARLRESGSVLLGKTTTPEFGWKGVTDSPRYGPTGNPWDPRRTAGGSSGGSATAVGLGMGVWSVGTDGGGSVRIPAAFTGTVALKPTYGLVPLHPPSPFGTLSHAGPMTRSVRDAAALLDIVSGFDPRDWSAMPTPPASFRAAVPAPEAELSGLRVAFSPRLGYGENDPEIEAAVRAAVDVLAAAGARVDEVDPGFPIPEQAYHVLWFAGAAKVLDGRPAGAAGPDRPAAAPGRGAGCRLLGRGLPGRHRGPDGSRPSDGGVPPPARRAGHPDAADPGVPARPGRAGRLALAVVDQLDPVHLPVQPDPAAGAERALRVHRGRAAGRAADRRPPARRRDGAAGRAGLPGPHRLALPGAAAARPA